MHRLQQGSLRRRRKPDTGTAPQHRVRKLPPASSIRGFRDAAGRLMLAPQLSTGETLVILNKSTGEEKAEPMERERGRDRREDG
ncbi:hypothetical protein NDU88_006673 [Pleurodeles waltl]|uniref:Uncharacterized protein n=1 Tax=Pleurodeles waltl TaxID=8319 RepID=A0AAV7QIE1_PLEWA|nr:hypothetical protein NDU88_006673 [Pleurodeles waltl]